ncbi:MAG: DUF2269 domain-containing protein [Actinomycetota bacterium]|nr:DUF2269 domain-containing protein [Actinomycetota bacterium]
MDWFTFVLFLHVLTAIVGFGPSFMLGMIAAKGGKEPKHVNFALRVVDTIAERVVLPAALVILATGIILIFQANWHFWRSEWLIIAVALYIGAFFVSQFYQAPTLRRLIQLTSEQSPPVVTGGAGPHDGDPADGEATVVGDAPAGPPPEVAALVARSRLGGLALALLLTTIVLLMVWKPGGERVEPPVLVPVEGTGSSAPPSG